MRTLAIFASDFAVKLILAVLLWTAFDQYGAWIGAVLIAAAVWYLGRGVVGSLRQTDDVVSTGQ